MRTLEPDPAPKPPTAAGHALGLRVSGALCETHWAPGANAAELLQQCGHVANDKTVRRGNDLEITHPRTTAIAVPRDQRLWGNLAHNRTRLTLIISGDANKAVCEGGVIDWTKGLMQQLVLQVETLLIHPRITA